MFEQNTQIQSADESHKDGTPYTAENIFLKGTSFKRYFSVFAMFSEMIGIKGNCMKKSFLKN